MAPSLPPKKRDAAEKAKESKVATPQTKQAIQKIKKRAQKPIVHRASSKVHKSPAKANEQVKTGKLAHVPDATLPKDDMDREVWARKVCGALLDGPKLNAKEASAKSWELMRSIEDIYRNGSSATAISNENTSAILERSNEASFAQHMDKLVQFIHGQQVKSDVTAYRAEDLLMILQNPKKTGITEKTQELDVLPGLHTNRNMTDNYIDLTMEPSGDETEDETDAGVDDTEPAEGILDGHDTSMVEYVPIRDATATELSTRAIPQDAIVVDLTQSESEKRVRVAPSYDARDVKDKDGLTEPAKNVHTPHFESDPFWKAHLETMKK
ncbi:hypothetical protein SLS60_008190 [Paraconiothyrium brasiliense]|uniref:Uncharacterized protein n=1 Tax=Paraconiothyrium brasiliense TaxID=300254 RepID=A0ABR3R0P2_9PLEO